MKGASLTGGGFGQTKLRGWRGSEKESSATVGAQTKAAEQLNGKETGKPSATGGELGRKGPTRQAKFGLERPAQWTG